MKIKIKKAPRTGDQQNYSLVYNDITPLTNSNTPSKISNTMKATNDGNENIEVEGKEVVVGDINYDGLLELMSFSGKRHSEGGMNVHIPDGSFIFSDTPKLKIKDPEILKYFNMGTSKAGYTPAQIAKKYQINEYVNTLKDDETDEVSKRTAHEMLKKNTQKLAELSLVQESSKGMPNGVPSFAENVMAGLQQPQMQDGGISKVAGKQRDLYPHEWLGKITSEGLSAFNKWYEKTYDPNTNIAYSAGKDNSPVIEQKTKSYTDIYTSHNIPAETSNNVVVPTEIKYPMMIGDVVVNNEQEYQVLLNSKNTSPLGSFKGNKATAVPINKKQTINMPSDDIWSKATIND